MLDAIFEGSKTENPGTFLKWHTPKAWGVQAVRDLETLMSDHAWCERKASGNCLSLLSSHLNYPVLTEPMIRLAREELEHFQMVYNLMQKRGLKLLFEKQNAYVRRLRSIVRSDEFQLLDRMLVAACIEARSCERLALIADALDDDKELKDFYIRLTRSEGRHFIEFVNLAKQMFDPHAVDLRLEEILNWEAESIKAIEWTSAVH